MILKHIIRHKKDDESLNVLPINNNILNKSNLPPLKHPVIKNENYISLIIITTTTVVIFLLQTT